MFNFIGTDCCKMAGLILISSLGITGYHWCLVFLPDR